MTEAKLTPSPRDDEVLKSYYQDVLDKVRELYDNGELGFEILQDKVAKLIEDYWVRLVERDEGIMKKFWELFNDYRREGKIPFEYYIKVDCFTGIWLKDDVVEIEYILKRDPVPEIAYRYENFIDPTTGKVKQVDIGVNWPEGVYKIIVPLKEETKKEDIDA